MQSTERIAFEVIGSQGDIYTITIVAGPFPTITCDCPAFGGGLHCRHRLAILEGDLAALSDEYEIDAPRVANIFAGSLIEACLKDFRDAERRQAEAKRNRDRAAKRLADAMVGRP